MGQGIRRRGSGGREGRRRGGGGVFGSGVLHNRGNVLKKRRVVVGDVGDGRIDSCVDD